MGAQAAPIRTGGLSHPVVVDDRAGDTGTAGLAGLPWWRWRRGGILPSRPAVWRSGRLTPTIGRRERATSGF